MAFDRAVGGVVVCVGEEEIWYSLDMKKLAVPLIRQREGAYHCQLATLLMITEYFGDSIEYDALLKDLEKYTLEDGMHNQGPAIYLLEKGYNVFFGHHDLGVLSPELEDITERGVGRIESVLAGLPEDDKNAYRREKLILDLEYIKKGGQYSTHLPTLELVDEYLEKGVPVVLGAVRNKGLHLDPLAGNGNHAVVVVGKDKNGYYINDPSPKSEGQYVVSKDRLLHAWYHSGVQIRAAWK